jgi:hypothetical protein
MTWPTISARSSTRSATSCWKPRISTETVTAMREGVLSRRLFRLHVPAESVEEQWDLPGTGKGARFRSACWTCRSSGVVEERTEPDATKPSSRRIVDAADEARTRPRSISSAPEVFHAVRAQRHAAEPGHALARTSGGARSSAAGDTPARLRAEEPEAGIQARGVRTVSRAARQRARTDVTRRAGDRADPRGRGCRGNRPASRRAERPVTSMRTTTRRLGQGNEGGELSLRQPAHADRPERSAATTPAPAARARSTSILSRQVELYASRLPCRQQWCTRACRLLITRRAARRHSYQLACLRT